MMYGMDIPTTPELETLAKRYNIPFKVHKILYSLTDDLKCEIENFINKGKKKQILKGSIRVNGIYHIHASKKGFQNNSEEITVAGGFVINGNVNRKMHFRVMREDKILVEGLKVNSLKVLKNNVGSVTKGDECGISLENYSDFRIGDIIESYQEEEEEAKVNSDKIKISLTTAL